MLECVKNAQLDTIPAELGVGGQFSPTKLSIKHPLCTAIDNPQITATNPANRTIGKQRFN